MHTLVIHQPEATQQRTYNIAGCTIISNRPISLLTPFRMALKGRKTYPAYRKSTAATRKKQFEALLHFQHRPITTWQEGDAILIEAQGIGRIAVGHGWVQLIERHDQATDDAVNELLIGPGLITALAFEDIYILHASSVLINGQAHLFMGESGRGKSTLARTLATYGYPRLTDDATPIHHMTVMPRYPQLKLAAKQQSQQSHIPLSVIYSLTQGTRLEKKQLPPAKVAMHLIQHTMATSLFNPTLRASHLQWASHIAERLTLYQLNYPHTSHNLHTLCMQMTQQNR